MLRFYRKQQNSVKQLSFNKKKFKKEHIWVSSNEVDETRAYYTEWNKSEREKQIFYINAYIWNIEKWHRSTYLQGKDRDADVKDRLVNTWEKEKVGRIERVALTNPYVRRVRNAVLGCSLWNNRIISVHFQGKSFNITAIQVYAPTINAEEAEVERFYEDLQTF